MRRLDPCRESAQDRLDGLNLVVGESPAAETIGVGLGTGLIALTSMWAAAASRGQSSYTAVGILFAVLTGLVVARLVSSRRALAGKFPSDNSSPAPEATPGRN